jgi:hypothetical protein
MNPNNLQGKPYSDFYPFWQGSIELYRQTEIFEKVRKRRELPHPTDEAIQAGDDAARATDIKIGKDGGLLTWIHTLREPIRGYAHPAAVNLTAIYKRLFFQVIESLARMGKVKALLTVFGLLNTSHILDDWFEYLFITYPVLLKDEHYCQPVKELRRVLRGKVKDNVLDAITLVIECDSAYKYRFQDIMTEMDQSKLKGYFSTKKELERLVDILKERDFAQVGQPIKFEKIKKVIGIALLVPNIRRKIISILRELNIDEIRLSKEDICFTNSYTVYKIGGRSWEERKQENIKNGNRL